MALDWKNCNYLIALYERDKPIRYEHHKTQAELEARVEIFKQSKVYYRIWWGKCETINDDDCEELGDWLQEPPPRKRKPSKLKKTKL